MSQIWGKTHLAPTPPSRPTQPRTTLATPLDLSNDTVVLNAVYVSLFASHVASLRSLYEECEEEMTRASRGSPEEDTDEPETSTSARDEEEVELLSAVEEETEAIPESGERSAESGAEPTVATESEVADEAEDRALSEAEEAATEKEDGDDGDILEDAVITDDGLDGDSEGTELDATDRRLLSIQPSAEYVETPRQETLSIDELALYSLIFDSSDAPVSAEETVDLGQQVLDDIITRAATVRETYVGSLNVPQEKDHAACRDLLRVMGVPIVIAKIPYEAEGLASALVLRGQADFAGSEDSDVIVYGVSWTPFQEADNRFLCYATWLMRGTPFRTSTRRA